MKTRSEVEDLKQQWLKNGWDDLGGTEGFEEYEDELAAFQREKEDEWERKRQEEEKEYQRKVEKLMNLRIGEHINFPNGVTFVGAPGGWIYETSLMEEEGISVTCCFIPYPDPLEPFIRTDLLADRKEL